MNALISRLSQPSTYAGFSGLALSLGFADSQYQAWATAAAAFFSLIAVVVGEANSGSTPNA